MPHKRKTEGRNPSTFQAVRRMKLKKKARQYSFGFIVGDYN